MFRYERPQKGRFRQFHQIDVELIGVAQPPGDIEVIALGRRHSGRARRARRAPCSSSTRWATRRAATPIARRSSTIIAAASRELSEDSLRRLSAIRCASSIRRTRATSASTPTRRPSPTISRPRRKRFLRRGAAPASTALGIAYRLNPRLVRGLDYYCHTAFEFVTTALGAQGTVLGGGRYDGLMGVMGGPGDARRRLGRGHRAPGAADRRAAAAAAPDRDRAAGRARPRRWRCSSRSDLRRAGFAVDLGYSGNLRRRMQRADKINARAAVILGDDELARGSRRAARPRQRRADRGAARRS